MLPSVTQPIYPGGSLGGLFSRPGLLGGFAAGFLGAGVLGVLFGHGMLGELSGVASVLGLIFQLILMVMMARLIWTWWRADKVAAVRRSIAAATGRRLWPLAQRGAARYRLLCGRRCRARRDEKDVFEE